MSKCFLIAYKRWRSLALESEWGKDLARLNERLSRLTEGKGVEIMVISSFEAYSEYAPFELIEDENEFIARVLELAESDGSNPNNVPYRGDRIQVGYMPGLGEWIAISNCGFSEGFTYEEAVEKAKKEIDKNLNESEKE